LPGTCDRERWERELEDEPAKLLPARQVVQNRYVGDIGDYVKLAILRALADGCRLGVCWWLFPDEDHTNDGRHVDYLTKRATWREFDPVLFDALAEIVNTGRRAIQALENPSLLPGASFASDTIPTAPHQQQWQTRAEWFDAVKAKLTACNLVFLDPDNGLQPDRFRSGGRTAGKYVRFAELTSLRSPGRSVVVYHHQTRRRGGHLAEIEYQAGRLRAAGFSTVDALRASPYSPRVFFILDGSPEIRARAEKIASRWKPLITLHSSS
jgi:hypothetical protein